MAGSRALVLGALLAQQSTITLHRSGEQYGWGEGGQVTIPGDKLPFFEQPDRLVPENAAEIAPRDNEIDFDDEQEEDQLPLDVVEAAEAGVLLDSEDLSQDE